MYFKASVTGILLPLQSGSAGDNWGTHQESAQEAGTGFVISQKSKGQVDLFRLKSLHVGEDIQKDYMVAIEQITEPTNPVVNPFGTFTVAIKTLSGQTVEKYTNVNFNPSSPDYIAKRIGDQYIEWDETNRRYRTYGDFQNQSNIVYVDLKQFIKDGGGQGYLPAGFKARGMRIRDEDNPLQPGEFRDIDTTGGSLRENLIPLPIKEPSNVLMQLLGILVDSGKRFAAIADMNVGDMNQAMPVGTTVALLERGTKVMSAIHKRLHYAQRIEFGLLAKVFGEFLPPVYNYQVGSGPGEVKQTDFDDRVDIIPVSDPNIFSQSQRVTLAQELLQMVQSNPEIHGPLGIYEAYRRMYAALGVDNVDALLQPPPDNTPKPQDAGLENAGLLMGQPAQAFPEQNHQAHLDAHKSLFLTDIVKQSPQVQALIISHCMQHLQFMAMQMAQEQMPPEVQQKMQEIQSQIQQVSPQEAAQIQQQMQMVTEQYSSTIMAQLANEFLQSIGMGSSEDPLVDIRKRELDLKDKELNMESEQFVAKQGQRQQEKMMEGQLQQERINVQKEIADDKLGVALDRLKQNADLKLFELENKIRGIL